MDFMKVFDQAVREIKREVNLKVLKVPEIEQKVLDATNEEPWGPHGSAMAEIANATRKSSDYHMVMGVLWKRIAETGSDWRHVYKALTVLEYLVAHGSERVLDDIQEHSYQLSALSSFNFVEPSGKDQGINVRKKSHSLMSLLSDKQKIQEVRKKAAANKDKYGGLSSTGGYKPSSYSSFDSGFQNDGVSFRSRNGNEEDKYGSGDRYGDKYSSKYGNKSQYGTNGFESSGREGGKYRGDDDDDDFERLRDNKDVQYSAMSEPNDTSRTQGSVGAKDEKLNKQNISSTSPYTDDDFDDFDPRGNADDFNPRGTTATGAVTSSLIGTDDLLGTVSPKIGSDFTKSASSSASVAFSSFIPPPPSAGSPFTAAKVSPLPQTTDFFSTSSLPAGNNSNGSVFSGMGESNSGIDLFGSTNLDTSLKTPVAAPKSGNQLSNDFFSQTSYGTSLSSHEDILSADFPSNATSSEPLFSLIGEEPATVTSKESNSTANIVNTNSSSSNGSFFDAFGNTYSSEASDAQTHSSDVLGIAKTQPAKEKFQPKSSIWADTLSRGLIDLDLSESKATASLVDIGIVLDPSAPEKKKEVEPKQPVATRGKAMGSGSGLGRLGASSLSFNASTFGSFESSMGSSTFGMGPTAEKVNSVGLGAGLGVAGGSPTIGMNSERNIGMKTATGSSFPVNYTMGPSQGGLDNNTQQFGRFS